MTERGEGEWGGEGREKRGWASVGGCPTSTDTALKALYSKEIGSLTPALSQDRALHCTAKPDEKHSEGDEWCRKC